MGRKHLAIVLTATIFFVLVSLNLPLVAMSAQDDNLNGFSATLGQVFDSKALNESVTGTMSPFGTKDAGFPPFFGDDAPVAQPAPQPTPQPMPPQPLPQSTPSANDLLGVWAAQGSGHTIVFTFMPNGRLSFSDNNLRVEGSYEVQGQNLSFRFNNGFTANLSFSIQGNMLILSDGSRLVRQNQPTPQNVPAEPTAPNPVLASSIEGAWVAQQGQDIMILVFMNGICGLTLNQNQAYGPYTLTGNHLHVRFNTGKNFDAEISVNGDTLVVNGTSLRRHQMPNVSGQPMPQGNPPSVQPQNQPMPGFGSTPLEGSWATVLPNGAQMTFVFRGNQYTALINGMQSETGTFRLNGNRLEYTVTSGQMAGQSGVNMWKVENNMLTMTLPNGMNIQFRRSM